MRPKHMSGKKFKRNFRKGAKIKRKNFALPVHRGGIRL